MESVKQASENISSGGAGPSLIKHVFNFDDDSKNEMMNIIQYRVLLQISKMDQIRLDLEDPTGLVSQ